MGEMEKKSWRGLAGGAGVLAIGLAAGYFVHALVDRPVVPPPDLSGVVAPPVVIVTNSLDDAKAGEVIAYLRSRIDTLEKELAAAKRTGSPRSVPPPPVVAEQDRPRRPDEAVGGLTNRPSRRDYLERVKQEDPERYAAIQKRIEDFRGRLREKSADRRAFLSSIDTSGMSGPQLAGHRKLVTVNERIDVLQERFASGGPGAMKDEERTEYFQLRRELGELLAAERRYLLESIGTAYGDDGAAFADDLEAIYEFTTPRGLGR